MLEFPCKRVDVAELMFLLFFLFEWHNFVAMIQSPLQGSQRQIRIKS